METARKIDKMEFRVMGPATGEEVGRHKLMGPHEVDKAVKAARSAFPAWSKSGFRQRKEILIEAAATLAENAEGYADDISEENGKTRMDAMLADVYPVAHFLKYCARNAEKFLKPVRVRGSILLPGRKGYYTFEPKGVIGVISPWNYPFALSAGPVISAIAAGNTAVLKPASQTTRSGLMVKEILEKSGLPEGVVQVITGSGSITGKALIEHPDLDMLFFTGSTAMGRQVYVKAAERLIPAVMELGGKDVAIITRNADLERAAHGTVWASFTNCGQTCTGTEVILVERAVYEPFLKKVIEVTRKLKLGDKSGQIGAMTLESQLKIVEDQVEDAIKKGARIETGGKRDSSRAGFFFPPTLMTNTTADMKVRTEETFGPLKSIVPYHDLEEAIAIANATEYGLSGSVYTRDMEEGRRIAKMIKTGSVNINDALITYAFPSLPFGGMKHSGVGRYHGKMGLRAFTDVKSITEFKWPLKREPYWYPVPEEGGKIMADSLKAFFSRGFPKRARALVSMTMGIIRVMRK